ncbi:hypothetical protein ACFXAZ_37130 [Streptomyces sp. NPDC059477]|uniref:hypothetical protein n=1 Tax=Streptomyces sp. NPDC059477 TaxID=3346847 RepID=UPI0036C43887
MLRGFVHLLAWSLATGAAVTLSWWGVHTVMVATAYDPPRALSVTVAAESPEPPDDPQATPTPSERPEPSGPPEPDTSAAAASERPTPPGPASSPAAAGTPDAPSSTTAPPASASAASGEVRSYDTEGGRAVFDIGDTSASFVSATPATGWSMQVWPTSTWIRVEFSSGEERVSVFCTWHDGPPRVNVETY